MNNKNKGGRPSVEPYNKRFRPIRFSQAEIDTFEELGYDLAKGVRLAVAEFIARGKRNEKQ